jgi:hypothetical protein
MCKFNNSPEFVASTDAIVVRTGGRWHGRSSRDNFTSVITDGEVTCVEGTRRTSSGLEEYRTTKVSIADYTFVVTVTITSVGPSMVRKKMGMVVNYKTWGGQEVGREIVSRIEKRGYITPHSLRAEEVAGPYVQKYTLID